MEKIEVSTLYHSLLDSILHVYKTKMEACQLDISKTQDLEERISKLTKENRHLQNM